MIDETVVIKGATAHDIYSTLMDSTKHSKLIGDKATIDPEEGGFFSAFSGYADGRNLKLVEGKLIEQTWRASDWDDDHHSTIRFELKDVKEGVEIHFTLKNLPEGTEQEFLAGWKDNYWEPLKNYFKN